jgi:hypothetical protein
MELFALRHALFGLRRARYRETAFVTDISRPCGTGSLVMCSDHRLAHPDEPVPQSLATDDPLRQALQVTIGPLGYCGTRAHSRTGPAGTQAAPAD